MQRFVRRLLSFPSIEHAIKTVLVSLFMLAIPAHAFKESPLEPVDPSCQQFLEDMRNIQKIVVPDCADDSFEGLNTCFQANLLRKGERGSQKDDGTLGSPQFAVLVKTFPYFVDSIAPTAKKYDVIVVLGSYFSNMQARLASALKLLKEGTLEAKMIVFLGSDRKMHSARESEKILVGHKMGGLMGQCPSDGILLPTTETEAIHYILRCSSLPSYMPPYKVLDTLARADQPRATTQDTIQTLVADKDIYESSKTFLFVSSQPFALLQEASIRGVLGPDVHFDMLADTNLIAHYGVESKFAQQEMEDTFARLLYQTQKNLKAGRSKSCPLLRPLATLSTESSHDEF